jgi:hypothetical protein
MFIMYNAYTGLCWYTYVHTCTYIHYIYIGTKPNIHMQYIVQQGANEAGIWHSIVPTFFCVSMLMYCGWSSGSSSCIYSMSRLQENNWRLIFSYGKSPFSFSTCIYALLAVDWRVAKLSVCLRSDGRENLWCDHPSNVRHRRSVFVY